MKNLLSSRLLSKNLKIKMHRNIIFPVVLYGCETRSLTLREDSRLRVCENRMLRRIPWPKRVEVTGKWRKLRNEELNNLYSSTNILRNEIGGACSAYRGEERRILGFGREIESKRPFGRPMLRWEDNIKMDL